MQFIIKLNNTDLSINICKPVLVQRNINNIKNLLLISKTILNGLDYSKDRENQSILFAYWFRWVLSDDVTRKSGSSLPYWLELKNREKELAKEYSKELLKRDNYVLYNIHSVDATCSIDTASNSHNSSYMEYINEKCNPWNHQKNIVYYWFLRRYKIDYARQIYGVSWIWNLAIPWLMIITSFLSILLYQFISPDYKPLSTLPLVILYMSLFFSMWGKMDTDKVIHSLIPRLAATSLVGFLFIVSTPDLIKFIMNNLTATGKLFLPVALFITSIGYIILEMTNRVKPMPDTRDTLWRAITVWGTGFMHSTLIILLCVDLLNIIPRDVVQFNYLDLFIMILINLSIGIVLNIVWEENPVTEPL